ncbi:unnamed protein product, partial [Heterosigma akashiwo]
KIEEATLNDNLWWWQRPMFCSDDSMRYTDPEAACGLLEQQASAVLLLRDLVQEAAAALEAEVAQHMQTNIHKPVLSDHLVPSYNAVLFSLEQLSERFLQLGHATWALVEGEAHPAAV